MLLRMLLFIIVNLPIRLVSNSSYIGAQYVGRLEILHIGQWGTVCNKSWTFEDSLVVCKELGYASTEQFYTAGLTNPATGKIYYNTSLYLYLVSLYT